MIATLFTLFVLFQLKHLLADYPLQGWPLTTFMMGKFSRDLRWIPALAAHAGVHAIMTYGIMLAYSNPTIAFQGSLVDFTIHFLMDRAKASPNILGRWKSMDGPSWRTSIESLRDIAQWERQGKFSRRTCQETRRSIRRSLWGNTLYWWTLGFDQMVHHLTDYFCIWLVTLNMGGDRFILWG